MILGSLKIKCRKSRSKRTRDAQFHYYAITVLPRGQLIIDGSPTDTETEFLMVHVSNVYLICDTIDSSGESICCVKFISFGCASFDCMVQTILFLVDDG